MATLTARGRKRMKASSFALPKQRKYPISDASHARAALSRVAQHGTPAQKAKVRRAVKRRFPGIAVSGLRGRKKRSK